MQSMESQKLPALEAALSTVEYQIKHLTKFYSYLQVRVWKKTRKNLKAKIKLYKGIIAIRKRDKRPPNWYDQITAERRRHLYGQD